MSEPYVLNKRVTEETLERLNNTGDYTLSQCLYRALGTANASDDLNQASDFISALKSGKKIVNPLSPREELRKVYERHNDYVPGTQAGIEIAIKIIAKEHPDVVDWLKDVNEHG
jgi:hypothetical protein